MNTASSMGIKEKRASAESQKFDFRTIGVSLRFIARMSAMIGSKEANISRAILAAINRAVGRA